MIISISEDIFLLLCSVHGVFSTQETTVPVVDSLTCLICPKIVQEHES